MNPELENHPGWQWCTAEGAKLYTLLAGLKTTFHEKIVWLEEAENLVIALREAREKQNQQTKTNSQDL
jgi:hypothetical protein